MKGKKKNNETSSLLIAFGTLIIGLVWKTVGADDSIGLIGANMVIIASMYLLNYTSVIESTVCKVLSILCFACICFCVVSLII